MKNLSKDTAEIRRKAPKEHRRTQGWLRQVAMPGEASGDARLASPGSDARWREEVMPGGTSGEVMRRKITGGSDAGACAPG